MSYFISFFNEAYMPINMKLLLKKTFKNFVLPESTACLQNHNVGFVILLVSNTILLPTPLQFPPSKNLKHFRSCQCKHFLSMYNIHFNLNLCAIYEFPLKLLKNFLAQQLKNIQLHLNCQTQGDIKCKSQLNKIKKTQNCSFY